MNEKDIRNKEIRSLYFSGQYTMRDIGERFDVSFQRIQQIIHPQPERSKKCKCLEPIIVEDSFCLNCLGEKPIPPPPPDPQQCCICGTDFIGKKRGYGKYPLFLKHSSDSFYLLEGRDKIRELVRIRDGHTCQECGRQWQVGERKLDVHHLKDENGSLTRKYDDLAYLKDMITLCHRCHMNLPSEKKKTMDGMRKKI